MLSLLLPAAGGTAVLAGVAGAWSPCGFSMVDTIGTALGNTGRRATALAATTFTFGALAGGVATFGGLSLLGHALGHGGAELRDAVAGALGLAAAFADWRGWKVAPQIRRQVPERWRWILPLPLACALYGLLLGLGFTTFVLSFAVWALAGISLAAGSTIFGLVVGLGFGLGRAIPVLALAPRLGTERGDRGLDQLAREPRLWLGIRRLDALCLGTCAILLGGSSALAAGPAFATDPSADGSVLAWQQIGGPGMLRTASATLALPGRLPAVGGGNVAWLAGQDIVVAKGFPSASPLAIPGPPLATVNALAVAAGWLVVRDEAANGLANLFAVSLADPTRRRYLAGSGIPGAIGRPSLSGSLVLYSYSGADGSAIYEVDLDTGAKRALRAATSDVSYAFPALRNGRLLYERVDRCAQELLLASPASPRGDRILLALPSTVFRDSGYEPGYTHAYNGASVCASRRAGGGGRTTLGSTALGSTVAYVSESPADPARTRIVRVPLG